MTRISDTDLRDNLTRYLDEAASADGPVVITRAGRGGNVVLVAEAEFAGWQETAHLLSTPRNAERLRHDRLQAEAGRLLTRELLPPSR